MIIIEDPVRNIEFALLERTERFLGWDISVVGGDPNRFFFLKSKSENYKKRAYTAETLDRIALIFVSATIGVICW